MNIQGGARRFKMAGRALIYTSLVVATLVVCFVVVALAFPSLGINASVLSLVMLPLFVSVPGAGLWFLGWVIEGFADYHP
jgi:uncharacterized membrane protein YbhN (UPF0104 family)